MANPQKENGYTPIANEILEALCQWNFSAYEFRIISFLLRKTYGFHKKEERITLAEFSAVTKIQRSHVCRTLKLLQKQNIITKGGTGSAPSYKLQKDYEKWGVLPVGARGHGVTKGGNEVLPKGVILDDYSIYIKDNKDKGVLKTLKKQFMDYEYVSEEKKRRRFQKVDKKTNNMFIAVGVMWINMVARALSIRYDEVPQKNLVLIIRTLWERENKTWGYDDFKELFNFFLNSKLKDEDKISFHLCMSEAYVAKFKIARKNKKETNASISSSIKL